MANPRVSAPKTGLQNRPFLQQTVGSQHTDSPRSITNRMGLGSMACFRTCCADAIEKRVEKCIDRYRYQILGVIIGQFIPFWIATAISLYLERRD